VEAGPKPKKEKKNETQKAGSQGAQKPFTWQTANSFAYVFRYFRLQCCCPTVCRSVNARRASAAKKNKTKKNKKK